MPALAPYIPTKESLMNNWLTNFSTLISANPSMYGLVAADATAIAAQVAVWTAAYTLCTSPTTKTAANVSAKNTAKVNTLAFIRPYAQQIANNVGVTSANKIALGLNPKTSTPTPITPPNSNPVLSILSMQPGVVNLTYRDSLTSPSSKAKPYGVRSLQLYGMASTTPITNPALIAQCGIFTKSPLQFTYPSGYTPGSTWYFVARWATQKGQTSPYSPIIQVVAT